MSTLNNSRKIPSISSVQSINIKPTTVEDIFDGALRYNKTFNMKYTQGSYNIHIPSNTIHENIARILVEHLISKGHVTFKTDRNHMTGEIETVGTINVFDIDKFNARYRPEYLI